MVKEFHDEWMDGKPEAAQEHSLIKVNLPMGKGTSLLALPKKTSPSLVRKLEPIPELTKDVHFQSAFFLKGMERMRCGRNRRERR